MYPLFLQTHSIIFLIAPSTTYDYARETTKPDHVSLLRAHSIPHTNPHLIIVFSDAIIWEDFT